MFAFDENYKKIKMLPGVSLLAPDLCHHLLVVGRLNSLIQGLGAPKAIQISFCYEPSILAFRTLIYHLMCETG